MKAKSGFYYRFFFCERGGAFYEVGNLGIKYIDECSRFLFELGA